MKHRTFTASSAIKIVHHTRRHLSDAGEVSATVTKRIDLELTAKRWQQLEFVTTGDPDWTIQDQIAAIVTNSRDLDELVAIREARAPKARVTL